MCLGGGSPLILVLMVMFAGDVSFLFFWRWKECPLLFDRAAE
jgi:hypothetical protein